jgi:hypothetical protein
VWCWRIFTPTPSSRWPSSSTFVRHSLGCALWWHSFASSLRRVWTPAVPFPAASPSIFARAW